MKKKLDSDIKENMWSLTWIVSINLMKQTRENKETMQVIDMHYYLFTQERLKRKMLSRNNKNVNFHID